MFKDYKGIITADMTRRHWLCSRMLKSSHCLIAGATGSGKSVMLNSMIYTAIREQPNWMYFIDLKRVELKVYADLFNCLGMVTEPDQVIPLLDHILAEIEKRYRKAGGRTTDKAPIYVFIDELADLVDGVDKKFNAAVLERLVKIGRIGRAAKVHLVCATQDPSRRCLSSAFMKNMTACLALRCKSDIDSRQVIGIAGAEELPKYGKGILWDSDGYMDVCIPMTPDEDIIKMVKGSSKRGSTLSILYKLYAKLILKTDCPYTLDPEYNNLINKYGDRVW